MLEQEFKKEFGMSFDDAYQSLLAFREESDKKWQESLNKNSVPFEVRNSISYQIKMKLKMESTLSILREAGYDV